MEQHKISEYIENLTFRKRVGGVDQEQVFEAIRELSSMYNELLMEAYEENENLKAMLEKEVQRNELRKEEVDDKLKMIMKNIHKAAVDASSRYGLGYDLIKGANIAGFEKVVLAMMSQGIY